MESDHFQSSDTLDGTVANNRNHLNLSVNTSVAYQHHQDVNRQGSPDQDHPSSDGPLFVPMDSADGGLTTGLTPESERNLPRDTFDYQRAQGNAQQVQNRFSSFPFGTGQPGSGTRSQFDGRPTPASPVFSHAHPQQSLEDLQRQYRQAGLLARGQTLRDHQQRVPANQERASRQGGTSRQQYQQHLQSGYQVDGQNTFQQGHRRQSAQYPQAFGHHANSVSFSDIPPYGPQIPSAADIDAFNPNTASSRQNSHCLNPYDPRQTEYQLPPRFGQYGGHQSSDFAYGAPPIVAGADPDPYHTRARELLDVYQIPTIPYLGNALQPLCWAPGQAPLSPRAAGEDHGMWNALIDHVFLSAQQSLYRLPTAQREPSLDVFNQVQFALKRFVDVVRHERVQIAMAHSMRRQGRHPSFELMPDPKLEAREEVDMGVVERQIVEKEVHRQRRLANQDRKIERGRTRADRATKKGAKQQEPIIRELPPANGPDPGASAARVTSAQQVKSVRGKGRQGVPGAYEDGEDVEYEYDDSDEDEEDDSNGQAQSKAPNGRNWYMEGDGLTGLPTMPFSPAIVASTGTDMAKIVDPTSYEGGQEGINRVIRINGSSKIKRTVSPSGADGAGPAKKMRAGRKPPPSATEGVPISRNFAESLHGAHSAMPVIHRNDR